ncbi:Hydroxyproline O-galactosyltransferase HPGT1 [Zea mays]|uniref:Hexosyltransferase n=1 Tax=Zea mays TaxID=4577 RepID=A0A1D6Q0M8_MAIZE|nr:Hydroxyproline O-galactosyltransferase HPGT1 [Zea mays]
MQIREGPARRQAPSAAGALRSPLSAMMLAMFATMASFYVAGRLWQDAQNRVYLIKELDRRTGQGQSAISVDDTLKVVACRQQGKRLASLEMELAAAKHEGFVGKYTPETNGTHSGKKPLVVIGIMTSFGRKNYRDAVRKSWLPTGSMLKKLEEEKGIVVRFVVGRSANRGDTFDREIDDENRSTKDFLILVSLIEQLILHYYVDGFNDNIVLCIFYALCLMLIEDSFTLVVLVYPYMCTVALQDDHIESDEELPKKTKSFFANAANTFDAAFYAKVNDDIYINVDTLSAMLETHWDKPRVYIGCMKSGEVFSDSDPLETEPTSGMNQTGGNLVMGNRKYFRHASSEMFVISRAIAQFISINKSVLRTYAHDDVSVGSWMIGLAVKHVNEAKLCCSSWPSGAMCSAL